LKLFSRRENVFSRRENIFLRRDNLFSRRENCLKRGNNVFYFLDKSLLYPEERMFIPLSGHRYKIFVFEIFVEFLLYLHRRKVEGRMV